MFFEITRISNGWSIKGSWVDPGGAGIPEQPRIETLYCKEINEIASVLIEWAKNGFDAAFMALQEILKLKEDK